MRCITTIAIIFVLVAAWGSAADLSKTMPVSTGEKLTGAEPSPTDKFIPLTYGSALDSPGDPIGTTFYDYQTNGSTGNRVAVCNDGSIYVNWTNGLGWPIPPAPRHVYHNWRDPNGVWNPNGFSGQVSTNSGAGYTTLDIIYGNRGAIVYHDTFNFVILSVDLDPPGLGFFDHYDPPDLLLPQTPANPGRCYWPYVAVDRTDRIHIVMTENVPDRGHFQRMGYARSSDGGTTWTSPQLIDTVMVISSVIDASPVSDRVVIAYSRHSDTLTQWRNDIYYVVSNDGSVWDFRYSRVNITSYASDYDSLWAYTDADVIFDYNDYFHIVWNAQWVTDEGVYFRTYLFHYSEQTGEINEITHHPDSSWFPISGVWNRPICKMNTGIQPGTNDLYVTWTQFDTSDVSMGGFGNGDIYMSRSADLGDTWDTPVNLTNSQTPGCFPGQCDSDHWSSLADIVDSTLHLMYINDKDAGGIPQTEGSATENPVMYYGYPLPAANVGMITGIATDLGLNPIEGALVRDLTDTLGRFSLYHLPPDTYDIEASKPGYGTVIIYGIPVEAYEIVYQNIEISTGIDDNESKIPTTFGLSQNYPNPFNACTKIRYDLPVAVHVRLAVYDILGRKIQTLVDKPQPAGMYQIAWDAADQASGVYFYKIEAGDFSRSERMMLLK
jgi:hypothetical protein